MMMNFYDGYVNTYPLNQTVGTLSQVAGNEQIEPHRE